MSINTGPARVLKACTATCLAVLLAATAIPQAAHASPPAPQAGVVFTTPAEGPDEALDQGIALEDQPSDASDAITPRQLGALLAAGPQALAAKATAPPSKPDYASAGRLAVSLSFPLYGTGTAYGKKSHPDSFTGGGSLDRPRVHKSYQQARTRAVGLTKGTGNISMPRDDRYWANCSSFTATVVNNTLDPSFPSNLTLNQWHYVTKPQNGWKKIGTTADYRPQDYKAGDIFLTRPFKLANGKASGHTFMWVGDHGGLKEVVAEASYGGEGSKTARMPALHVNALKTEKDRTGRSYDVWRFVGKPEPTAKTAVAGTIDWNRDGRADIVSAHSSGLLYVYPSNGKGGFAARKVIGNGGWQNMRIVTVGDVGGDEYMDLVAMDKRDGKLYFYPGRSNGLFGSRTLIGTGFKSIRDLVSPGDISGDGIADLVGVGKGDHALYSWTLSKSGKITSKKKHYSGWKGWSPVGGSDIIGNGMADLIVRSPGGALYAYPSNHRNVGFPSESRTLIGTGGWSPYLVNSVGDFSGDGRADVIARDKAGRLWLYPGKDGGSLGSRVQIGTGWNSMQQIG
ncbi:FG-GAP repeat domain-containing protein [Leucobacter tenebrionis]|uniref:FG-GAP repeat domain-containing protein n=1 Tax=Leucobacter tenebrionis TaxID=2873270 RepID=UPI001CA6E361|nr:VCBS repeat-containing protein [Leucobacter tenebrionis]QZY52263.1 FG-GAP-like repeat-containing protein [Leucobacter tenebrionis]